MSYFIALNDLHVYFFNFFYGDKELFRLAFMLANESFFVKPFYPNCIGSIIDNKFHGFGARVAIALSPASRTFFLLVGGNPFARSTVTVFLAARSRQDLAL